MGINPKSVFSTVMVLFLFFSLSACQSNRPRVDPPPAPGYEAECPAPQAPGYEAAQTVTMPAPPKAVPASSTGTYCTWCGTNYGSKDHFCGGCGKSTRYAAPAAVPAYVAPAASVVAVLPAAPAPVSLAYFKLGLNEIEVVELIEGEGIWFDEIWADLYLQNDWREKLDSIGGRLEPAPAGYWCPEVMVVRGQNSKILKKWMDVRGTKTMAREGGVCAQIHKLVRTNDASFTGISGRDGSQINHPQVLFALNRAENYVFDAPADSDLTPNGKFSKLLYQRSY